MLARASRITLAALLLTLGPAGWAGAASGTREGHGRTPGPAPGARLSPLHAAAPGPTLRLLAAPRRPFLGEAVRLRVSGAPADAHFRWDWTAPADGRHDSGSIPGTTIRPLTAALQRVTAQVISGGRTRVLSLILSLQRRNTAAAPERHRSSRAPDHPSGERLTDRPHIARAGARTEHGTRDPAVTIADFHFTPATITIHVGDTVTWTNQGPSPHTATASDGSFNTGVLNKGQSASHTFTKPGTFTYTCQIHPFMHGTVVVLAAASPPSSGPPAGNSGTSTSGHSASGGTTAPTTTATPAPVSSQPTLPVTGSNIIPAVLVGLLLFAGGLSLRLMLGRDRGT
jgi:plastocyanin